MCHTAFELAADAQSVSGHSPCPDIAQCNVFPMRAASCTEKATQGLRKLPRHHADNHRALLEKAERLNDVAAYDHTEDALAAGDDELAPAVVANALLDGESPVRVWRQHRDMSRVQLAAATGISQAYPAQIETGKREGTSSRYRSLADAPGIDLDDLVG